MLGLLRLDGTIVHASPAAARLVGCPPESLPGTSVFALLAQEDAVEMGAVLTTLGDGLERIGRRLRVRGGDGTFVTVDCRLAYHPDEDLLYCVAGIAGPAPDAEQRSGRSLRSFLDNSPIAAWVKDEHLRYVFANAIVHRTPGFPRDYAGKRDDEIWPANTYAAQSSDLAVLRSGTTTQFEEYFVPPEGALRCNFVAKFPFESPGGSRWVAGMAVDVSEMKRAETQLRESNARAQAALAAARLASWVWDPHTDRIAWDLRHFHPVDPEASFPESRVAMLQQVDPEDRDAFDAVFAGGTSSDGDDVAFRYRDAAGALRWYLVRTVRLRSGGPLPYRIHGVLRDITEARRTELSLQSTVATLQATLEAAADAILVVDEDGHVTAFNRKAQDLFGCTEAQMRDAGWLRGRISELVTGTSAGGPELEIDPAAAVRDVITLTDGRVLERHSQPKVRQGRLAGRVWSLRDVTARVRAERQLRITQAALDRATDPAFFADHAGRIVYTNASACTRLGYDESELRGMTLAQLDAGSTGDLAEAAATGTDGGDARISSETLYRCKDGSELPVEVHAHLLEMGSEQVWCLFARDISERKLAEARVRRAAAELALAGERERKDLARALHDSVVQDLALVKIKLGLLPRPRGPRAAVYDELRTLLDGTIYAARSVLFEISPPVLYDLGLPAAVEWLAERFGRAAGLAIRVECDGNGAALSTDMQVTLFQVLRELLTNVRKHARARNVLLRCRRTGARFEMRVSDDGIGFDEQAGSATAFGLFSIRDRVSLMGGEVRIDSRPGIGTDVLIDVPWSMPGA
ncbi:MAG: PAS domain S-box protein [Gammaproteobacteria bacterium]